MQGASRRQGWLPLARLAPKVGALSNAADICFSLRPSGLSGAPSGSAFRICVASRRLLLVTCLDVHPACLQHEALILNAPVSQRCHELIQRFPGSSKIQANRAGDILLLNVKSTRGLYTSIKPECMGVLVHHSGELYSGEAASSNNSSRPSGSSNARCTSKTSRYLTNCAWGWGYHGPCAPRRGLILN